MKLILSVGAAVLSSAALYSYVMRSPADEDFRGKAPGGGYYVPAFNATSNLEVGYMQCEGATSLCWVTSKEILYCSEGGMQPSPKVTYRFRACQSGRSKGHVIDNQFPLSFFR